MALSAATVRALYNTVLGSSTYGDALALAQQDIGADGFIWNDLTGGPASLIANGFARQVSKSFAGVTFPDGATTLATDPRVSFVIAQQNDLFVSSEALGSSFGRDEYHRNFLEGALGTRYTMGFATSAYGQPQPDCLLGIHNLTSRGSFSEYSKTVSRELLNTIRQVRRLQFELHATRLAASSGETALNSLGEAVFVTDKSLRLRWTNKVGESFLRNAEVLFLSLGFVCCRQPWQSNLLKAVNDVLSTGELRQIPIGMLRNQGVLMTVAPCLEAGFVITNPLESGNVVMRIHRIVKTVDVAEQAAMIYGLTKAEAFLVADLAAGKSVTEHSQVRGVKISTVRYHVRAILDKTSTRDLQSLCLLLGKLSA